MRSLKGRDFLISERIAGLNVERKFRYQHTLPPMKFSLSNEGSEANATLLKH